MKQKLCIFLLLIMGLSSKILFGQSYWAPIGAKWYYDEMEGNYPPNKGYVLIEAIKDSLLNGKNSIVLQKTYFSSLGDTIDWGQSFTYFANDIVYLWKGDNFQSLYVFSSDEGESWTVFSNEYNLCGEDSFGTVKVDSIITKEINSVEHKYLYTSPDDTSIWDLNIIIENIGSTNYMLPLPKDCGYVDIINIAGPLRCYSDSLIGTVNFLNIPCDTLINLFTGITSIRNSAIKIYPNPVVDKLSIESSLIILTKAQIYNSLGQLIRTESLNGQNSNLTFENLPTGIYHVVLTDKTGMVYSTKIILGKF